MDEVMWVIFILIIPAVCIAVTWAVCWMDGEVEDKVKVDK